jgi:hypothetical protein
MDRPDSSDRISRTVPRGLSTTATVTVANSLEIR